MRYLLIGQALGYAVFTLATFGLVPDWGRWFGASDYHRIQTERLVQGKLGLSDDPAALRFDLAWSQGSVQQVWGLGVPVWRLPFDTLARLGGWKYFPDRLIFGVALVLTAFLVLQQSVGPVLAKGFPELGGVETFGALVVALGAVLIWLLFPPFLSLLQTRFRVYEEVLAYVYLYATGLLCGLMALVRRPRWWVYWITCAGAGAGAFIRPTLFFYGGATLAAAMCSMGRSSRRAHRAWRWWVGALLFSLGGALLFITNHARFGSGLEFGHRLNHQGGGSMYETRFDYPFEQEPAWRAGRELFGALFLARDFNPPGMYAEGVFPGQSPTLRWRDFYFRTFDPSFTGIIVLAAIFTIKACIRLFDRRRLDATANRDAKITESAVMGFWWMMSASGLALFYLRTPVIASRYMMDFAPAFAAATVMAWRALAVRAKSGGRVLRAIGLAAWFCWEIATARAQSATPTTLTWDEVEARPHRPLPEVRLPEGQYTIGDELGETGIPFNGTGWQTATGAAQPLVAVFVNHAQFLELELEAAEGWAGQAPDPRVIRAKIGLEFLKRQSIHKTGNRWTLRFAGPQRKAYRTGIQAVFIALATKEHLADRKTAWQLDSIRWRDRSLHSSISQGTLARTGSGLSIDAGHSLFLFGTHSPAFKDAFSIAHRQRRPFIDH